MVSQANQTIPAEDLAAAVAGWSDAAHGSLSRRLANALRQAITAGLVAESARLPAERSMAGAFGVGRSTVTAALDELRSDGLVESRQGSGTVVVGPGGARAGVAGFGGMPVAGSRLAEHFSGLQGIDLASGNPPDPAHWPPIQVGISDLISDGGGPGVHPLGLESLRSALADTYIDRGLITSLDEVHVTSGSHQALALILRGCCGPGDAVALEETNYPGIFDIVESLRCRVVPLQRDRAGILPESLERAVSRHKPRAVYLQNGPHNPTGGAPSPARIRQLAEILDRSDAVVIEDSALADLTFAGRVSPEVADLCRRAMVASVGSFSKVAWAGLRIGWMRAPAPLVERTMHLRLAGDLGPSVPSQLFALRLLPHYEEMAAQRRVALEQATRAVVAMVADEFPGWSVVEPEGGANLWIELPIDDSGPFVQVARRYGVHVAPGSAARAGRAADPHIRVCVDRPRPLVEVGFQRLGLAWWDFHRQARPVLG